MWLTQSTHSTMGPPAMGRLILCQKAAAALFVHAECCGSCALDGSVKHCQAVRVYRDERAGGVDERRRLKARRVGEGSCADLKALANSPPRPNAPKPLLSRAGLDVQASLRVVQADGATA